MTKKSFKGVAYWTVNTAVNQWAAKAMDVLLPLEAAGLGVIEYTCIAAGDAVTIRMGDDQHQLLINNGNGRGVVAPSAVAALFVVCLVALRKHLGDIDLVDDAQKAVPTTPRQNNPLFRDSWLSVMPLAEVLGVLPNQQAVAAMRRLFV